MIKCRVAVAVILALVSHPTYSATIIGGDSLGVFPDDSRFPNVGDDNIFVGRERVVNSFRSGRDGRLEINTDGGPTQVTTERGVFIGVRDVNRVTPIVGEVVVDGIGAALRAGQGIFVGTDDPGLGGPPTSGIGVLTIRNGGFVKSGADDLAESANLFGAIGSLEVGNGRNTDSRFEGSVTVDGAGSRLEGGSIILGNTVTGAAGSIRITNGGVLDTRELDSTAVDFDLRLGDVSVAENSSVLVSGDGSTLNSNMLIVGSRREEEPEPGVGILAPGQMSVTDGARVLVAGGSRTTVVGLGAKGELEITGTGTRVDILNADPENPLAFDDPIDDGDLAIGSVSLAFDNDFNIVAGSAGSGRVRVADGGVLAAEGRVFVGGKPVVFGELFANAGVETVSSGILTIADGGVVEADEIVVGPLGVLGGDGGVVDADVRLVGGSLNPGASPGVLTILGDLILEGGVLNFEIDDPNAFDLIEVQGDVRVLAETKLNFIFGDDFSPVLPIDMTILSVLGDSGDLASPLLELASIGGANTPLPLSISAGGISVQSNGVAPIPLPAPVLMLMAALGALIGVRSIRHGA